MTPAVAVCHEPRENRGDRIRTCETPPENQALATDDTPQNTPAEEKRLGGGICEVVAAWPDLSEPLRVGILAIVRSQIGATKGEQP